MKDILRVPVAEARSRVSAGEAILVCAYEDLPNFRSMHLEGAIFLKEFRAMIPSLDKGTVIIFYCA